MAMREISITVTSDIADAFARAPNSDKEFAVKLFSQLFQTRTKEEALIRFHKAQDELSAQARNSGLTQAVLDQILDDKP